MKYEVKGVGIGVHGYEENYIHLFDDKENVAATTLLSSAGAKSISWSEFTAFQYGEQYGENDHFFKYLKEYRRVNKKDFPTIYKIKISVEVEALSDEESKTIWEKENLNWAAEDYNKLNEV